jgi:spermidine synthase
MRFMLGVFFTSMSLIALEIGITRIFSTMVWYHLSFMAISLAMLGYSLGGIVLLLVPSLADESRKNFLPTCSFLFALTMALGTLYIFCQTGIVAWMGRRFSMDLDRASAIYLMGMLLLFIAAFFLSGLTVSTAISRRAGDISRVYFANLTGSGLGCLLIILMLSYLGAFKAMLAIVLIAVVGSIFFLGRLRNLTAFLCVLDVALLLAVAVPLLSSDSRVVFARALLLRRDVTDQNRLHREWNSFSCVDFFKPERDANMSYEGEVTSSYYEGLWGLSRNYRGKMLDPIKVVIDSWAITSINKVEPDTLNLDIYDYLPTNLAYQVKQKPKVLIMGAGGGIDVLSALHYHADKITAVEINPAIVDAVKTRFADFAGHIYDRRGVNVVAGEGRHYINKDTDTYDLIQLSGVDTLSGAQASSYSFSESYLYTLEAFKEYLAHLNQDGIITFLRFSFKKPREMLRLFTTAAESLRAQGIQDVENHIVVVHSNVMVFANLMIKKSPFTPEELERLDRTIADKGFRYIYRPYQEGNNEFHQFIRARDWRTYYDQYPYRIYPVTDDNPFFFNYTKLASVFQTPTEQLYWLYWVGQTILFYGLIFTLLLSVVFIFGPLLLNRMRGKKIAGSARFILYFVGLGLAFMFVEILLMQRFTLFLGQPVYSLALVLFSLMIFAGLGSHFTGRLPVSSQRALLASFGLLLGVLLMTYLLTGPVFHSMLKQNILVRAVISIVLMAPASFLMGFPFPLAVRLAARHSKAMVPWGWAINGYASVIGSFLSVVLGVSFGFTNVYFIALGLYLMSALLLASLMRTFSQS